MNTQSLLARLAACAIAVASSSASADLKNATVAMTSGNWKVLRDKDAMTDKTDCTGIYRDNYGVQLTAESLYLSVSGGLESVTLRFGDEPVRPLRLPTDMEKKVRVIILTGTDFEQLQSVSRLRYQASTLVSGIKTGDLDLTGLVPVLENIKAGCPVQAAATSAPRSPDALTGSLCNAALVGRMRQQGIKDAQIAAVCRWSLTPRSSGRAYGTPLTSNVGHLFTTLNRGGCMTKWLDDWFSQTSTGGGNPTRRAISDVHTQCSDMGQELIKEAMAKNWHVVETDTHYVVIPSGTMKVCC